MITNPVCEGKVVSDEARRWLAGEMSDDAYFAWAWRTARELVAHEHAARVVSKRPESAPPERS